MRANVLVSSEGITVLAGHEPNGAPITKVLTQSEWQNLLARLAEAKVDAFENPACTGDQEEPWTPETEWIRQQMIEWSMWTDKRWEFMEEELPLESLLRAY